MGMDGTGLPVDPWLIYRGDRSTHDGIQRLPKPPPWRDFTNHVAGDASGTGAVRTTDDLRARTYRPSAEVVETVNAALYLRRPLLVTGKPGVGKSSLALSIAYELQLGPVLSWPVTSRSTVAEALYRYDAVGRLQESNILDGAGARVEVPIGRYIRLGPLGTALLPGARPRVLLVDEFDKGDLDLPNDLLTVIEEGQFEIAELCRLPLEQRDQTVMTAYPGGTVEVAGGIVRCTSFPIMIITSNEEREFPPAFLRRCLRLHIQPPDRDTLAAIVADQLGAAALAQAEGIIGHFLALRERGDVAADQLLNAVFIATSGAPEEVQDRLRSALLQSLGTAGWPR